MMLKISLILLFVAATFTGLSAQLRIQPDAGGNVSISPFRPNNRFTAIDLRAMLLWPAPQNYFPEKIDMPNAFCYDNLGFFCRVEIQIEKASGIPFRFRLGDIRYVDYLEGKTHEYELRSIGN